MRTPADPGHARGRKLLAWLEAQDLSITAAAKKANVGFAIFNNVIVRPRPNLTTDTLTKIISALGCPLEILCPELAEALAAAERSRASVE